MTVQVRPRLPLNELQMIKKIYAKIKKLSKTLYGIPVLCLVALLESFIFPIPPDIFLIFLILAFKKKTYYWRYLEVYLAFILAFLCTIFSVAGGILGYSIGNYFFESLGQGILNYYNLNDNFLIFSEGYNEHGILIVLAGGFTPIPYKLITIFSGFVKMNFYEFISASIISRGVRFFLIATLLYFFGERIEKLLIKRFGLISLILLLILLIIYFIIKHLG